MRLSRALALGASVLVLVGACSTGGSKPADGQDRLGRLRRSQVMAEIYAQALEANGYTVDRTGIGLGSAQGHRARPRKRPDRPQARVHRQRPGVLRARHARPAIPPTNQQLLQDCPDAQGPITVLDYTPAPGHERLRRPQGDGRPVQPDQDERPDGRPERAQVGLATDCPTNPVCAAALKSAPTASSRPNVTLLDACSAPMADALKGKTIDVAELCSTSPRSSSTAGSSSRTTSRRSRPTTSRRSSATTTSPRSTRPPSRRSSTTCRPRSTRATLTDLYKQVAVDKKDIADVAKTWLTAQGFVK